MGGQSAYVHSDIDNANVVVSADMINHMVGFDNDQGMDYVNSTIAKLDVVIQALDTAADRFLDGISLDRAQNIADNAQNLLTHLANSVLYGPQAENMMKQLLIDQTINLDSLLLDPRIEKLEGETVQKIKQIMTDATKNGLTAQKLAAEISKTFQGSNTEITISTAGTVIKSLGAIFDIDKFNAVTARKGQEVMVDSAFEATKASSLSSAYSRTFRKLIIDLVRSSKYMTSKGGIDAAINRFCDALGEAMKEEAKEQVHFMWSDNPKKMEETINDFIDKLKKVLPNVLNPNRLTSRSNAIGEIGETVRESISKTANSVVVSFQMGDLNDQAGIDKVHKQLINEYHTDRRLSKMFSYHDDKKQSFTDLVLLNTQSKRIARAQSKNHFAAYFTKETKVNSQNEIENFRWAVEEGVNLYAFLNRLSTLDAKHFGITLNDFDMSNILDAIANNIWFQSQDSYEGGGGHHIIDEDVTVEDFRTQFKLAMEKLLAGQVTHFLGVTVIPLENAANKIAVKTDASNIFYVLNGRLKKTAELVVEAKTQLLNNESKLKNNGLVNVKIRIGKFNGGKSFLIEKLRAGATPGGNNSAVASIGQAKGEEILNSIEIGISLGTSIKTLAQSSMIW